MAKPYRGKSEPKEFEEKVIQIKRISKKTKGGNKISFSALLVVGDGKGRAGMGMGKAPSVIDAIHKGIRKAKRNLIKIDLVDGTIAHEVMIKHGAAKVLLKPAPKGTGVIAGGAVRAVVEAFGVKSIVSKRMGTTNKAANVQATFEAMRKLKPARKKQTKKVVEELVKKSKTDKKVKSATKEVKKAKEVKKPKKTTKTAKVVSKKKSSLKKSVKKSTK